MRLLLALGALALGSVASAERASLTVRLQRKEVTVPAHALPQGGARAAAAAAPGAPPAPGAATAASATPWRHHRRAQDEFSLYGDFRRLAYFYADVFIGSPSQKFTVITDTGSSLTAVPCLNCRDCGNHLNPRFNPGASSTATRLGCGDCSGSCSSGDNSCPYSQSYAEGSTISGILYRDLLHLGSDSDASPDTAAGQFRIPFVFGCQLHEGGLFTTQEADGIMGLSTGSQSIISALWSSGKLHAHMFSLCLSFSGGAMTLGDTDPRLNLTPMAWARMAMGSFYSVFVSGFALEGSDLGAAGFASPHTILDSGTTFTYVPGGAFQRLNAAIAGWCSGGGGERCQGRTVSVAGEGLCYALADPAHIATFPSVTIALDPATPGEPPVILAIRPPYLFVAMGWDNGAYCLAIYDNGNNGGVIGANALMEHNVVVDLAGSRAGFAESACDLSHLVGGGDVNSASASGTATSTPTPTPTASPSAIIVDGSATGTPAPPSASPTPTATGTPTPSITPAPFRASQPPSAAGSDGKLPSIMDFFSQGWGSAGSGGGGGGGGGGGAGLSPGATTACVLAALCCCCACAAVCCRRRGRAGGAGGESCLDSCLDCDDNSTVCCWGCCGESPGGGRGRGGRGGARRSGKYAVVGGAGSRPVRAGGAGAGGAGEAGEAGEAAASASAAAAASAAAVGGGSSASSASSSGGRGRGGKLGRAERGTLGSSRAGVGGSLNVVEEEEEEDDFSSLDGPAERPRQGSSSAARQGDEFDDFGDDEEDGDIARVARKPVGPRPGQQAQAQALAQVGTLAAGQQVALALPVRSKSVVSPTAAGSPASSGAAVKGAPLVLRAAAPAPAPAGKQ